MTLRLPIFEAKTGGKYRYEHSAKNGTYVAEGYFKEFNSKNIVQTDLTVRTPDGTIAFENLECSISFIPKADGTEVQILQSGFTNQSDASDCEKGWEQSLNHLDALLKGVSSQTKVAS